MNNDNKTAVTLRTMDGNITTLHLFASSVMQSARQGSFQSYNCGGVTQTNVNDGQYFDSNISCHEIYSKTDSNIFCNEIFSKTDCTTSCKEINLKTDSNTSYNEIYTKSDSSLFCHEIYSKTDCNTSCNEIYSKTDSNASCHEIYSKTDSNASCHEIYLKTDSNRPTSCSKIYSKANSSNKIYLKIDSNTSCNEIYSKTNCANEIYLKTDCNTSCNEMYLKATQVNSDDLTYDFPANSAEQPATTSVLTSCSRATGQQSKFVDSETSEMFTDSNSPSTPACGMNSSMALVLQSPNSVALLEPARRVRPQIKDNDQDETGKTGEKKKPSHSYVALITMAILSSPEKKMVLRDIYSYVRNKFPFYNKHKAWRNSIRHNLTVNECFVKADRCQLSKTHYWTIHHNCMEDFEKGNFPRRRPRRQYKKKGDNSMSFSLDCALNMPSECSNQTPGVSLGESVRFDVDCGYQAVAGDLNSLLHDVAFINDWEADGWLRPVFTNPPQHNTPSSISSTHPYQQQMLSQDMPFPVGQSYPICRPYPKY